MCFIYIWILPFWGLTCASTWDLWFSDLFPGVVLLRFVGLFVMQSFSCSGFCLVLYWGFGSVNYFVISFCGRSFVSLVLAVFCLFPVLLWRLAFLDVFHWYYFLLHYCPFALIIFTCAYLPSPACLHIKPFAQLRLVLFDFSSEPVSLNKCCTLLDLWTDLQRSYIEHLKIIVNISLFQTTEPTNFVFFCGWDAG